MDNKFVYHEPRAGSRWIVIIAWLRWYWERGETTAMFSGKTTWFARGATLKKDWLSLDDSKTSKR